MSSRRFPSADHDRAEEGLRSLHPLAIFGVHPTLLRRQHSRRSGPQQHRAGDEAIDAVWCAAALCVGWVLTFHSLMCA